METACSGLLEIYVDGATEGKPGPAGICGVLRNISCQVILSFLTPVRWKDSNEGKVLAVDKCFNSQKKDSQPTWIIENRKECSQLGYREVGFHLKGDLRKAIYNYLGLIGKNWNYRREKTEKMTL